ncbi:MAG: virulence RhuM family protein [Flavobacteriales bacterium]|nr:virulence RhuM family protein [Flavobacteriales bacterium]MBK6946256.1 virulence RhuM family protein [Flavobacteriales bacterium]MBK7238793.1 virulence RhuM family protein [Flavobacteriales bacterium]MBK9537082.1 virulence RhuM family protein [Flavobacteriales bacterium]HQV52545.1 virulence RhuM family protein [Flavobacteriales bacterium]
MSKGELLIYQGKDGFTQVSVRMEEETVWLNQNQLADLFQTTKQNVGQHIKNIVADGELDAEGTVKDFFTVAREGRRNVKRLVEHYNLDMIISVGYRVNSHVGVHFRRWASERLKEYIIKGFVLDDARLKQARDGYFDELLSRIRDIRTSEKLFYRKVCDIYATSIDYNGTVEASRDFFSSVQNKFHWAIHGHTAAEVVMQRADASKLNMGLTNWPTTEIRKQDVVVAKNYLGSEELDHLNRIVNQYLEFAELQAVQRKPMHMADWKKKLHDFLTLNEREILLHGGKVSHEEAEVFAQAEFEKFSKALDESKPDELDKALKRFKSK